MESIQNIVQTTSASDVISEKPQSTLEQINKLDETILSGEETNTAPELEKKAEQLDTAKDKPTFSQYLKEKKEAKRRETELTFKLKDLESKLAQKTSSEEYDRYSPMEILKHHGFTIDDVNLEALGKDDPNAKETRKVAARLEKWEKEQEEAKKKQEEASRMDAESKQIAEAKKTLSEQLAKTGDEDFEFIKRSGNDGVDLVFDVIVEWHASKNEIIPFEKAAQMVEAHLESKLNPYLETKKVKKKYGSTELMTPKPEKTETVSRPQFSETLTQTAIDPPKRQNPAPKSRAEEIAEAINSLN